MEWWTIGLAAKVAVSAASVAIGAAGIHGWTRRSLGAAPVRGGAPAEDLRERQRQALVIHDNVVQGLATAKLSLELGETQAGMRALEDTLEAARRIISDLHDGPDGAGLPQALRRPVVARTT